MYLMHPPAPAHMQVGLLLSLQVDKHYQQVFENDFPLFPGDYLYGKTPVEPDVFLRFYLDRPFLSEEQVAFLIRKGPLIIMHFMNMHTATQKLRAVRIKAEGSV